MSAGSGKPVSPPARWWPGEPTELWRKAPATGPHRCDPRPAAERIAAMREPPIVDHPRARQIREGITAAVLASRLAPWGGLMLHGPAGNGRTTLALSIADHVRRHAGGPRAARVLRMPPRAVPQAFWLALHAALDPGTRPPASRDVATCESLIAERARVAALDGLRLMVVDGCDVLLHARATSMRTMLGVVAHMSDVARIPVLMVGSTRLAARMRRDRDHVGHVEFVELPPWRVDADWLVLLRTLEAHLPLRLPSGLSEREMALHLWALSEGRLGPLWTTLRVAAEAAIRLGYESIDVELLDDLGLHVPDGFGGFAF